MRKSIKICSILMCIVLLTLSVFINASAETVTAIICGTSVKLRSEPNTTTSTVFTQLSYETVTVLDTVVGEEAETGGGTTWYKITFGQYTGYIYGKYVVLNKNTEYVYDEDFEKNLLNFPESYREPLRKLHANYPNWEFVAHKLSISFTDAVTAQYGVNNVKDTRKVVELNFRTDEYRDERAKVGENEWLLFEDRWTYASYNAIAYYMDPRGSLNTNDIFVFMQQSFDSATQTKETLRSVVAGTFLENGYNDNKDAYLDDIMEAANQSGVSPYVLAATIITEQGTGGTSDLISGTYSGYEGLYNFFNFGASGSGDMLINSGLQYAKDAGWDTRSKSIIGGALNYADGYISVGQDTYYYKDFNVVNQLWWHQYAAALYDAWTNANRVKPGCIANTSAKLVFKIPVYSSIPDELIPNPAGNPVIKPPPSQEETEEKIIPKGDTNFDGAINAIDLAAVKMHILGVKTLQGDVLTAADVDSNGTINAIDLAAVKMHILGVKTIQNN